MSTRTFFYVYGAVLDGLTTLQVVLDVVRCPTLVRMMGAELLVREGLFVGATASPRCGLSFAEACAHAGGVTLYGEDALDCWKAALIDAILSARKVEIEVLLSSLPAAPAPIDNTPVPGMILDIIRSADERAAAISDMETLASDLLDE